MGKPFILTGLNQTIEINPDDVDFFGATVNVIGHNDIATIRLTPNLLRELAKMATKISDELDEKYDFGPRW